MRQGCYSLHIHTPPCPTPHAHAHSSLPNTHTPTCTHARTLLPAQQRHAHTHTLTHTRNIGKAYAMCYLPPAFCGLPTRRYTWGLVQELLEVGGVITISNPPYYPQQQQKCRTNASHCSSSISTLLGCMLHAAGGQLNHDVPCNVNPAPVFQTQAGPLTKMVQKQSEQPPPSSPPAPPAAASAAGGGSGVDGPIEPVELYSDRDGLYWCLDIARALDYLHSLKPVVVHRDVRGCMPAHAHICTCT